MAEGQEPPAEEAANAAAPAGEEKKEDGRIAWFEKRISAGIKTKPAVAAKFLQGDEFVKAVERFCESSHVLVVQEKQNGDLTASNSHVAVVKKALVFYKVHDDHITEDNIKSIVCCQEVGPNCVDLMLNATRDVYSPVLGRNGTQLGLSEIVAQELQESLNRLISGSQVVVGKMMGKTILPLPPDDTCSPVPLAPFASLHRLHVPRAAPTPLDCADSPT
jgi:dynein heavy chain